MIPYITKVTIRLSDGTEVRGRVAAEYQCKPSKNHRSPQTLINVLFDTPTVALAPLWVNIEDTTKYYEYNYKGAYFSSKVPSTLLGVPPPGESWFNEPKKETEPWFATVVYPPDVQRTGMILNSTYKG